MLGRRLPKNRSFSYEPSYYNPEKEEREGHKIQFKRQTRSTAKRKSLISLFVLLAVIAYFLYFLSRLSR